MSDAISLLPTSPAGWAATISFLLLLLLTRRMGFMGRLLAGAAFTGFVYGLSVITHEDGNHAFTVTIGAFCGLWAMCRA